MNCRHCNARLDELFLDLGHAPPSNAYRSAAQLDAPEIHYPLRLYVCANCWLAKMSPESGLGLLMTWLTIRVVVVL